MTCLNYNSNILCNGCFNLQLKLFHSELLAQLEQKLELDIKYLTVSCRRSVLNVIYCACGKVLCSYKMLKTTSSISLCSIILFQATLKKYQGERRSKSESIERCQSQLKKLRRKSQGSRHPNKYGDREMQVIKKKKSQQSQGQGGQQP